MKQRLLTLFAQAVEWLFRQIAIGAHSAFEAARPAFILWRFTFYTVLFVWGLTLGYKHYNLYVDPVKDWFHPIDVIIPSHCEGEDPEITYIRNAIKDSFEGIFSVIFKPAGVFAFPVCGTNVDCDDANGICFAKYDPRSNAYAISGPKTFWPYQVKPAAQEPVVMKMRLSEFTKMSCHLPPGKWDAPFVYWKIDRSMYAPTSVAIEGSLPFTVYPKDSPRCKGR